MAQIYSPKIITDSLVMCLDASQNKSYPTDLPVKNGLLVWLDAADDSTFSYSSGTEVSQWRDKSGLNNHVGQSTVGSQPNRNVVKNSRKSIYFDGGDSLFNAGDVFPSNTTDYTKIAVVYQTSTSNSGNVISSKTNNSGTNYAHAFYFGSSTAIRLWHSGQFVSSTNDLALNTLGIVSGTYINSSGLGSLYVNGTASGTGTAGNRNIVRDIQIGAVVDSSFFIGEICEVLVFSRVLSATELKQVHTYLGQKWGISNTDRSIVDLVGNNTLLFGTGNVSYMPYFDFYNKGALKFDGSNDFAGVASTTTYGTNTTWEAWVNRSVSANEFNMFMGAYLPYFGLRADGSVIFSNTINSTQQTLYSAGFTSSNDTWYYLSFTTDYNGTNTTARIYINGVLNNSATFTGAQSAANEYFGIGDGRGTSSWYPFNGKVSNVKVYNRTLSATEISQNYEAQKSKFANTIVQQGLVLNLDAGNNYSYAGAGTTWIDVSGNSNNGTLINSPTYSSDNSGVLNWASVSSQYATVAMNSGLRVANITQEVWVFLNSTADQVFIGMQYGTGSNNSFALWVSGGTFYFGVNTGGTFYQSASSTPSTSTWYHLVHTYNGTTQYLYINGVLATTYNSAASGNMTYDTSNTLLAIGADFNGTGYNTGPTLFVNGKMPIVKIYNIALSAAQVLQNYNATKGRFGL
jgi:hypothetical protein